MPKLKDWLKSSVNLLKVSNIPSPYLDAELILMHTLKCNRTFLHANNDIALSNEELKIATSLLERRINREPIAYLVGQKEFYSRNFLVTKDTLIPRPESEQIIEFLKSLNLSNITNPKLADVGTGSGCLGITAKLERPELDVTLIDISSKALEVSRQNIQQFNAKATIIKNDLLNNIKLSFDIIIANLPYVNKKWERSPETSHEPGIALFAEDNGMELIKKLFSQCTTRLNQDGYLIIEADPIQHIQLIDFALDYNLELISEQDYILLFKYLY